MQVEHQVSPILTFFPRFVIALISLQFTVLAIHSSAETSSLLQQFLTEVVAWLHGVFGTELIVKGNILIHQHTLQFVVIDNECTGLMLVASVCAAIIGLARTLQNTLKMVVIAVIILQAENIIRIAHLFFEIGQADNNFEFYHIYVWQVVNFITGLVVFFVLEKTFNKK
jgi:exosortase/archaeosortase family protein